MMQFEGVLLLLVIARVGGLEELWKLKNSSHIERTVKTILETCYPNDSLAEPIGIYGDFNELIHGSSIVRLNNYVFSLPMNLSLVKDEVTSVKPGKILLTGKSTRTLIRDLELLRDTRWWNHMARFFIFANGNQPCEDFRRVLAITWKMDIPNSIYICAESMNVTALYTLNPISDYAPNPWKRVENLNDLYAFHQVFDTNKSCENLNYDKTENLNGHKINVLMGGPEERIWRVKENAYNNLFSYKKYDLDCRVLDLIIEKLNGSVQLHFASFDSIWESMDSQKSDITVTTFTLSSYPALPFVSPHRWAEMIAVVKLSTELSTLQKILHLWSFPVLIAAGIALLVLSLILTIMNRSLFLAMLDIVRLLTYTSIHTNARRHWFRIYFTTMLIFMVISNGVFQGKIAAFLTKQERAGAIEAIDELVKLNYSMYTSGTPGFAMRRCSECNFTEIDAEDCIQYVLNSTRHVCGLSRSEYEKNFLLFPLESVKQILNEEFMTFKCRHDWPLKERVNNAIMRLIASGIIDFWKMQDTYELTKKRQEMEAEWFSDQYKPVKLYKLEFAFQLLAYGLGLAIIAFFLEILWANYGSNMVSTSSSKIYND